MLNVNNIKKNNKITKELSLNPIISLKHMSKF